MQNTEGGMKNCCTKVPCTACPTQEMPLPIEHIGAQVHRLLLQLQIQLKIILFKGTAARD
jgi:hypothetical protein